MRRLSILLAVVALLAAVPGALAQPRLSAGEPEVSEPAVPTFSPPIRTLPAMPLPAGGPPVIVPRNRGGHFLQGSPGPRPPDPLVGPSAGRAPNVRIRSVLGLSRDTGGNFFAPPDVIGDVGPNHYVQAVNGGIAVATRQGQILVGPLPLSDFWNGTGSCASETGDVMVAYDELADRWVLGQFASGNGLCIAVSRTADPTGVYALYHFTYTSFPDYPKLGVWPDAYYVGVNYGGTGTVAALERATMLAGTAARKVTFSTNRNYFLPADHDGAAPPPAGAPGLFYTMMDDEYWAGQGIPGPDRLEVWALDVDWTTPSASTFTQAASLPTAPFNYTVCGWFNFNCAPQPGTGTRLDVVSEWPMWRAAYRRMGADEVLVGSFAVDVTGTNRAGIRWFELRNQGAGWTLRQEGTHAPDTDHRYMSSAAMNADGVIALGYAVSSTSTYPSLRVALRHPNDPLGQLRDELSFVAGAGSQTGTNRYGDYFALSVDPVDDRTFWFTGEYYRSTSSSDWATRVGTIRITGIEPEGAAAPLASAGAAGAEGLRVSAPYPNPAAHAATVTLTLGAAQHVRAELVGALGQRLAVVYEGRLEAGERQLLVPVAGLPAGLYVLRVRGEHEIVSQRLLVAR
jgi:hypothetical protein